MDSAFESDATEGDKSSGSGSLAGSPSDGGRRAALYARVSTDEERQTPKTQLFRLREYAGHRGFSIAGEYVDIGSGLDPDRPEYQRLIGDARQRAFDVVIVWRYDRLARSTQALIDALKEFQALGVEFISHQEQIDTTTPQGEMVFGFVATLAQFESRLISQRVKAGMQRAKEEGKDVGRPSIAEEKQKKIRRLYSEEDVSISQVAEQVGVAYGTAWNYVQDIEGD
ncbi:DNA invertase Pin-like site-specific DNA recombinase [Salinibacter ruber]|uniref:recombinase family protein n=1 Tax=Salinibacter ruber TaxID=146919 RepID=UPI0021696ED6|nr:recombinase family protein [Salinibacter ruber]MCS3940280.1 DNA invertase Pin-like site-specific DNA recombinase [Salinibacter ruber]